MAQQTSTPKPFDPSVPTEPRHITKAEELWSEFKLDDGTTLRVRPIVVQVSRAKNKYSDDGNPLYFFQTTLISSVQSPAKLRRKQKPKKRKSIAKKAKTPKKT